MLHDDECEDNDNDSTTAASDAATAARDRHARQAGLSRFVDNDGESSQPPLLCTGRARSKGAIGLQAGQERAANKGASGKQGGSCDGFRPGEIESEIAYREELAHDDIESGTEGVDGEDDETDEELAEETCGETLEEEDVETEGEVEAGKWGTRGDRRQPQEEDSEADADGVGKGVNNLADDVVRSSPPPANEMPREILQQVERSTERASAQHLEKDNEENTGMLSVEEERSHGAGAAQSDFAPPSPVVPSMIQVGVFPRTLAGRWEAQSYVRLTSQVYHCTQLSYLETNFVPPTGHHRHGWRTRLLQRAPARGKPKG